MLPKFKIDVQLDQPYCLPGEAYEDRFKPITFSDNRYRMPRSPSR